MRSEGVWGYRVPHSLLLSPVWPKTGGAFSLTIPRGERDFPINRAGEKMVAIAERQNGAMRVVKTAKELVREIGLAVQPPEGVAIVLTEDPGALPNWVAAAGIMEPSLTVRFSDKVAELRNTNPNVDWGDMDQGPGEFRRVVKFSSERTD
jgi:hypothetical protein